MISTYTLIETQIKQLDFLQTDLEIHCSRIQDDRIYLEQEAEIADENGDTETANKYYEELDMLVYPVRKLEAEIRTIKRSIVEDYAELILTSTGDVSLANSILKAKRNLVQMDKIIGALQRKFNN